MSLIEILRKLLAGRTEDARNEVLLRRIKNVTKENQEFLGEGSFGKVWKMTDITGFTFAVKMVGGLVNLDSAFTSEMASLDREYKIMKTLNHPRLVRVYGFAKEERSFYLAMEYMMGGTLDDMIKRAGKLEVLHFYQLLEQIADALSYLHSKGIVHNDIKPNNILCTASGSIKLSDFGLSKHTESLSTRTKSVLVQCLHYASPEVAIGKPRCKENDIWSVGATAVHMLSGNPLNHEMKDFEALNAIKEYRLAYQIPPESQPASWVFDLCFQKPHDRPTAQQLWLAVNKQLESDEDPKARKMGFPESSSSGSSSNSTDDGKDREDFEKGFPVPGSGASEIPNYLLTVFKTFILIYIGASCLVAGVGFDFFLLSLNAHYTISLVILSVTANELRSAYIWWWSSAKKAEEMPSDTVNSSSEKAANTTDAAEANISDTVDEVLRVEKGIPSGIRMYTEPDLKMIDFFGEGDPNPLEQARENDGHRVLDDFKNESVFMSKSLVWKVLYRIDDYDVSKVTCDGRKRPFGYPKAYYTFEQDLLCRKAGVSRDRLALKPDWMDMGRITILLLPPGLIFYHGQAAPQGNKADGAWLNSGAHQIYIPNYAREPLQDFTVKYLEKGNMLKHFLSHTPNTEWDSDYIEKLNNMLASDSELSTTHEGLMGKLVKLQRDFTQGWYAEGVCDKRAEEIKAEECFGLGEGAKFGSPSYYKTPSMVRKLIESGHNAVTFVRTCNFAVHTPLGVTSRTIRINHPYQVSITAQGQFITGG